MIVNINEAKASCIYALSFLDSFILPDCHYLLSLVQKVESLASSHCCHIFLVGSNMPGLIVNGYLVDGLSFPVVPPITHCGIKITVSHVLSISLPVMFSGA